MKEEQSYHNQLLSIANQNPVCHLATVENEQPRVRGMHMWYADETGFYFHTASCKQLAKQIVDNPKVEIAFYKPSENPMEMMAVRVSGKVEILNTKEYEQRLYKERPWLNDIGNAPEGTELVVFRVSNGEAFLWDLSKTMYEDNIPRQKI